MAGRDIKRMALLLPFSAKSSRLREEAASMLKAAELSVFDREGADVVLVTLDTGGTARGAKAAAQTALSAGVDVILGPVLSGSVKAASDTARRSGVPVVAFSTDQTAAGRGTYLLSFPPEAEVERIVEYAASTGISRFAYFGPEGAYGRRVKSQYGETVNAVGGELTASESYDGDDITVRKRGARAEDPMGFYGADGFVRFNADGTPDRGLAVFQIRNGQFRIIDPAPRSAAGFSGPS